MREDSGQLLVGMAEHAGWDGPLARRRPSELARQTVSLQNFSRGRLILGEPTEWDFRFFGNPTDAKTRAEMLDEGLHFLTGLWSPIL